MHFNERMEKKKRERQKRKEEREQGITIAAICSQ
jgi:hypothetical protein